MNSNFDATTIYIELLNEGTICYRPTIGVSIGDGVYSVQPTPNYDSDDEEWLFLPGTLVRCAEKMLSGGACLVAVEQVDLKL